MATFTKTAALSVLLGIFIIFVVIFFVIVGCTFFLLWLRRKNEDQQELLNSGFIAKDIDDDESLGRRQKRLNHNDEVFEMEVLHCGDSKDEMTNFQAQLV